MKVGIIGLGNMGSAIASALLNSNAEVVGYDLSESAKERFSEILVDSETEVVKNSDCVIMTVKPFVYEEVFKKIHPVLEDQIIISVAPAYDLQKLEESLPDKKFVMCMPNTPALVGEAMTAICPNDRVSKDETEEILNIFSKIGRAAVLKESEFKSFGAVCGCMPAYVFMFIEAAADAAVMHGLKRSDAYEFIAQAVMGSAKLMLETKKHPAELKDMVTTPSGTTIEGLYALEKNGFRNAVMTAIDAIVRKEF